MFQHSNGDEFLSHSVTILDTCNRFFFHNNKPLMLPLTPLYLLWANPSPQMGYTRQYWRYRSTRKVKSCWTNFDLLLFVAFGVERHFLQPLTSHSDQVTFSRLPKPVKTSSSVTSLGCCALRPTLCFALCLYICSQALLMKTVFGRSQLWQKLCIFL